MLKLLTQQTVKNTTKLNKLITSNLSNETLNTEVNNISHKKKKLLLLKREKHTVKPLI